MGVTFLACKEKELPVGETVRVSLDALTREHLLRHHRLDPTSERFFQPFRSPTSWVKNNYASTGLQAVNTQTFANVFLHERGRAEWGFADDYVRRIRYRLRTLRHGLMPLAAIAIWTGKDKEWRKSTTLDTLVQEFLSRYNITRRERQELFARKPIPKDSEPLLQQRPPDQRSIAYSIALPPDADEPEGTLTAIQMQGVGPADELRLELGDRLTVVAGDNGLGKSFLLDVAWWAATGRWAGLPATPFSLAAAEEARIEYELRTDLGTSSCRSHFYHSTQSWVQQNFHPHVPGLYVYARLDGSFSIADDQRERLEDAGSLDLTPGQIWDGQAKQMEGFIRDSVRWQTSNEEAFALLEEVLNCLSPSDLGALKLGEPRRRHGDPRPIPVIRHPYGDVPVLYASAGVRRALALAYVISWTWLEHRWAAEFLEFAPARRMVLIVDEVEAHLHPFWQRTILPAILMIEKILGDDLQLQILVSTHSPIVLASLEASFSNTSDVLYHFDLQGTEVELESLAFHKHGDISAWLTSRAMGLPSARPQEAENAIQRAMELQSSRRPVRSDVEAATEELLRVLPGDDHFWRRWTFFARQAGVDL